MPRKVILVVDDDEGLRELVRIWLTNEGHSVITAVDGHECIKKLNKDIDLILLDIMMPGPTPAEIVKIIKKKSPNAIIAYMTAIDMFGVTPEQEKKGWTPVITEQVKGYIKKPIEQAKLIAELYDLLEKHEDYLESRKRKK